MELRDEPVRLEIERRRGLFEAASKGSDAYISAKVVKRNFRAKKIPALTRCQMFLESSRDFFDLFRLDTLRDQVVLTRPLGRVGAGDEISDDTVGHVWAEFEKASGYSGTAVTVERAIRNVADKFPWNPYAEYMHSVKDKEPLMRGPESDVPLSDLEACEGWLRVYGRAADTPEIRWISAAFLVGVVARSFEPGCKLDSMLVLAGPQGGGKSRLAEAICPRKEWFARDPLPLASPQNALPMLRGRLIYEIQELTSLLETSPERGKAFLTTDIDSTPAKFSNKSPYRRRLTAFVGTTNSVYGWNTDSTGSRRFWPVEIGADVTCPLDLEGLVRDRDRLWGAAVRLWLEGFDFRIPPPQILAKISAQQATLNAGDPWVSEIGSNLRGFRHTTVSVREVADMLDLPRKERNAKSSGRIRRSLDALGWQVAEPGFPIDRQRHTNNDVVYKRTASAAGLVSLLREAPKPEPKGG